eukprot:gene17441-883_t
MRSPFALVYAATLVHINIADDCPCPGWCTGKHGQPPALPAGNGPVPGVITVSQTPGAANCTTIQGAVLLTRNGYRDRYTIQVAPGYYKEKVTIGSNRPPITMVGISDQEDGVLVQWEDCDGCVSPSDPIGEWRDQTLWVGAADFRVENMSFAGAWPKTGRNMAVQVQGDRASFHNSRIYGDSSDTLFTGNSDTRAYFSSCYINGTYDFLWGVGSAVFIDCEIVGSDNIAAHKGSLVDRNGVLGGCIGDQLLGHSCTAYLMLNCRLSRPWRNQATTVYKSCWMDDHIAPVGWSHPNPTPLGAYANLTFAEFNSTGPGASISRPLPAQIFTAEEAAKWTPAVVLKGWNPLVPSQQPWQ